MSVLPRSKHFALKFLVTKEGVLLLGCLLAQQGASAASDSAAIFFQASPVPVSASSSEALSGDGDAVEVAAFAMFEPMADSARVRALITSVEEEGDYYSPQLAELAQDLGNALQAEGQHRAALDAYDRGFQILRRQQGLASAAQAAILRAEIDSQVALGALDAADVLQQALFGMQQQLLEQQPLALAEAQRAAADWDLKYYLHVSQTAVPGGRTAEQHAALAERLAAAFTHYHQALWLLSTADAQGSYAEKAAIERRIAAVTLMVDRQHQRNSPATLVKQGQSSLQQSRSGHNPVLFDHGSAALQRAIEYSLASAEPTLIAERQLELADWGLLMDQHDEALATYKAAIAALRDAGVDAQRIAALLESGRPVHNPETALLALARDETVDAFDGYIDVSFDLNPYGEASNARVLAGSAHDAQVEQNLLRHIREGRFRPGFEQGRPVARSEVTLRYYFAR